MTGPVRLDGGLATELQRAGLSVRAPWWTTGALLTPSGRATLRDVHERFRSAGAALITANTFRCNLRTLLANGLDRSAGARLIRMAVELATVPGALVAGSVAPVADCYRPDLVPSDDAVLHAEHRWLATELLQSGVDLVLIETMNTLREARIALAEALTAGADAVWVSFVCSDGALLSGEPLAPAARAVEQDGAGAVLVNCTTLIDTEACLVTLRAACHGPIGAYPNLEDRSNITPWTHVDRPLPPAVSAPDFAATAHRWQTDLGATLLGGCCGASPDHVAALTAALGDQVATRPAS